VTGYPKARGHLEVTSVSAEEEANRLLAQGWELFSVVAGGGEHLHYILTRRAVCRTPVSRDEGVTGHA
jgi:hypothetical protein